MRKFDPPTERERLIIQGLTLLGMNQEGIAELVGCSISTLAKVFPDELAVGSSQATAAIAGRLYSDAMGGNTTAQIFWLKCRGRWRERDAPEAAPPGDRADVGPTAETELPIPLNGPKLGGLTLIGPAKTKPVNAARKANGQAKEDKMK